MLHVAAFGLAGVTVGSIAFLGWSWFNFREDRKPHPIYKSTALSSVVLQDYRKTPVETHCAKQRIK